MCIWNWINRILRLENEGICVINYWVIWTFLNVLWIRTFNYIYFNIWWKIHTTPTCFRSFLQWFETYSHESSKIFYQQRIIISWVMSHKIPRKNRPIKHSGYSVLIEAEDVIFWTAKTANKRLMFNQLET